MNSQPAANRQYILGLVDAGQYAEAVTRLKSLCANAPDNDEAFYMLGCNHVRLGQLQEAVEALRQSTRIRPDRVEAHTALGGALCRLGRNDEAAASFNAALALDDTLADVHVVLADIASQREEFSSAVAHLEKALSLDPRMSRAHTGLGRIATEQGNHSRALVHLENALKENPQSVNALCLMASTLMNLSRNDDAVACYHKALAIAPDSIDVKAGLALFYEYRGAHNRAAELIAPLIEKDVSNPQLVLVFARLCKYTGKCREAIDMINKTLELPAIPRSMRRALHFTAGKTLDSLAQYDEAFAHYKAGNELATHLYDAVGNAQFVNDLISTFTPALFMQLPYASIDSERMIFIVGMPRSGTSLTEQILAAHPQVYGAGELNTLNLIMRAIPHEAGCPKHFPACIGKLGQAQMDRLARRYLEHVEALAGPAGRVTDKMPHNFVALGVIQLLFPQASIIHCRRDPLDTGLSIYFQNFLDEHNYAKDLFNIGVHYHQYQRLMHHWKQVLSLPILDVEYEELVDNQEAVTRRMLEFCGLEWDAACLRFHELDRHVATASYEQVRQPIYTKSVGRWRNYEQYLVPLRDGLERGY